MGHQCWSFICPCSSSDATTVSCCLGLVTHAHKPSTVDEEAGRTGCLLMETNKRKQKDQWAGKTTLVGPWDPGKKLKLSGKRLWPQHCGDMGSGEGRRVIQKHIGELAGKRETLMPRPPHLHVHKQNWKAKINPVVVAHTLNPSSRGRGKANLKANLVDGVSSKMARPTQRSPVSKGKKEYFQLYHRSILFLPSEYSFRWRKHSVSYVLY